jgi:hypothetical protein
MYRSTARIGILIAEEAFDSKETLNSEIGGNMAGTAVERRDTTVKSWESEMFVK